MPVFTYSAPIAQEPFNALMHYAATTEGDLCIDFSSEGGSVSLGFTMYEYLRSLNRPIMMRNIGSVGSSAIIPFLAADVRTGTPFCRFMIHRLASEATGPASILDLKARQQSLQLDIDHYNLLFNERTHGAEVPLDILQALNGLEEIHLSAIEAIRAGMICGISGG